MKKNMFILIISLFIMFGFNIVTADAVTCNYGIKEDNGSWNKQFAFEVGGWDSFEINGALSPYITGQNVYDFKMVSGKNYSATGKFKQTECTDVISKHTDGTILEFIGNATEYILDGLEEYDLVCSDDELLVYASLYPTETVYNDLGGKCPPYLKYEIYHEKPDVSFHGIRTIGMNVYHVKIYNDDIDHEKLKTDPQYGNIPKWVPFVGGKNVDWLTHEGELSTEGIYVLEEYKDTDLSKLVDDYDCVTYSSMMTELQESVNENGSCDDNEEFNKKYRELQTLCDSFRSSSLYATDDSSEGVKVKSCATACSMFKDDIAAMCDAAPSNQFCGSLGGKLVGWVFKIVRMARYFVPAVLILLSVLDYVKAIASDSEDEMKEASGRFVKRLIAGALIFIIPFILDFILKWFDIPGLDPNNPFCAN